MWSSIVKTQFGDVASGIRLPIPKLLLKFGECVNLRWVNHLSCFSSLICKMWIITVPISEGCQDECPIKAGKVCSMILGTEPSLTKCPAKNNHFHYFVACVKFLQHKKAPEKCFIILNLSTNALHLIFWQLDFNSSNSFDWPFWLHEMAFEWDGKEYSSCFPLLSKNISFCELKVQISPVLISWMRAQGGPSLLRHRSLHVWKSGRS